MTRYYFLDEGMILPENDELYPPYPGEKLYYLAEDVEPLVQLLRDYRKALEDGPENCGGLIADELQERADALLA